MRIRLLSPVEFVKRHRFHNPEYERMARIASELGGMEMTAWQQQVAVGSKSNQNIPATTETTVATAVVNNPSAQAVVAYGFAIVTWGAGSTGATLRIRQDTITGSAINNPTSQAVTAATTSTLGCVGLIPTGEEAGRTFVLTVTKAGGAAADTCVEACLVVNAF